MNEFLGLAYFAEIPTVIDVQRAGPSMGMPTRTQQADITSAFYASHGDTKHVLLFPSTPLECFELTAAFDLAERLQTPIMVMTDLDLGMNDHMSDPLTWDASKTYDRGKVLTAEDLDKMEKLDVTRIMIKMDYLPDVAGYPSIQRIFLHGARQEMKMLSIRRMQELIPETWIAWSGNGIPLKHWCPHRNLHGRMVALTSV
jgi:hypothetical protein